GQDYTGRSSLCAGTAAASATESQSRPGRQREQRSQAPPQAAAVCQRAPQLPPFAQPRPRRAFAPVAQLSQQAQIAPREQPARVPEIVLERGQSLPLAAGITDAPERRAKLRHRAARIAGERAPQAPCAEEPPAR